MNHSEELRKIAMDIVKNKVGGLHKSQYWGLRLKIIADMIDSIDAPLTNQSSRPSSNLSPFRPHTKEEFEAYGRFIDQYFSGG